MNGSRYPVLRTTVDALDVEGAVARIALCIADARKGYCCVANVHMVMEALRAEPFARILDRAELTVPDGMPLVWVGRWLGRRVSRVYGPDLTLALCDDAARKGHGVAFYGGADGVAVRLGEHMRTRFPGLRVVAALAPPFREQTTEEDESDVRALNASGADIVFVGLGCPRQELWMAAHRDRLVAPMLIGVGAAFDFHTGRVPQAPPWMRAAGLEWLFRLGQEPRRLWRRYLLTNPLFLANIALQLAGWRRYDADGGPPGS